MLSTSTPALDEIVAFLSVAGDHDASLATVTSLSPFAGQTIIEHQIGQLATAGIGHFLIFVEAIPGAIIDLPEKAKKLGIELSFVRSFNELAAQFGEKKKLFVLAQSTLLENEFLHGYLQEGQVGILTIDARKENQAYETIDLHRKWAGVSIYDASLLQNVEEIPSDWDMQSALLRRAVQAGVSMLELPQSVIAENKIGLIQNHAALGSISKTHFANEVAGESGFIERSIFGPAIAALLNRQPNLARIGRYGDYLGLGAAAFSLLGVASLHFLPAFIACFLSLFALQASKISKKTSGIFAPRGQVLSTFAYVIIALALILFGFAIGEGPIASLAIVSVLSLMLAQKLPVSNSIGSYSRSSALMSCLYLAAFLASVPHFAFMIVPIVQIAALFADSYRRK